MLKDSLGSVSFHIEICSDICIRTIPGANIFPRRNLRENRQLQKLWDILLGYSFVLARHIKSRDMFRSIMCQRKYLKDYI